MDLNLLISFIVASVLLSLMPGPDNIFVLTESITKGKKNGIAISIGLCLGVLTHILAAATGLSILIQNSTYCFSIIKLLGSVYLFYLAFIAFKEKSQVIYFNKNKETQPEKLSFLIRKGFLMNVLNPKVSLFFIVFLPQFIKKGGLNATIQMIILGLIFIIQAILIFSFIAILASKLTKYVSSTTFWKVTKWSKISILVTLAVILSFSEK